MTALRRDAAGRPTSSAARARTSRRWSRPRARRSIGACACCRAPSATRCTRSTPSAARSTTSPTAMARRRRSSPLLDGWRAEIAALFAGRPRSADHARAGPAGRALRAAAGRVRRDDRRHGDGRRPSACGRRRWPSSSATAAASRARSGCSRSACSARAGRGLEQGALALGEALQLTNILRDLAEDAGRGRLYLPRELLERHGIAARDPDRVLAHPALPEVCAALAERARRALRGRRAPVRRGRPAPAAAGAGDDAGLPAHARAPDRARLAAARPAGARGPARAPVAGAALRPALSRMAVVHVVGAGLAGLAAAIRLSERGQPVRAVRGRPAGRRPLPLLLRPHASAG